MRGVEWSRKTVSVVLLAVVVPVGFLAVWRITQLQADTSESVETVTLEPVEWEFEKCSSSTGYPIWFKSPDETHVKNMYRNGVANITHTVVPAQYIVNFGLYEGSSFLGIRVNLKASVTEGFVENVSIVFSEDYEAAEVCLVGASSYSGLGSYFYDWENLTIRDWADGLDREWRLEGSQKAFVKADGKNHPKEVLFSARWVEWILRAPENASQRLEITAEVTYYNGTGYVKAVLPILISLVADIGDSFEDARTITAGSYPASISSFHDPVDFYRIGLAEHQSIMVTTILRESSVNVTLYDPSGTARAGVKSRRNYSEDPIFMDELTYVADAEGYWYIKVESVFDQGIYKLTVEVEP